MRGCVYIQLTASRALKQGPTVSGQSMQPTRVMLAYPDTPAELRPYPNTPANTLATTR